MKIIKKQITMDIPELKDKIKTKGRSVNESKY